MKKVVLIIDDDEAFSFLLSRILIKTNHVVWLAKTIESGMEFLSEKAPDIVFLDNQLPDGLGWGKAAHILEAYPDIQLNLISALEVPKTSTLTFRIIEKQVLLEELHAGDVAASA
jgi:two-component SAPR family response regulator